MTTDTQHIKNTQHPVATTKDFDGFYEEISRHWQEKARSLQARRWRKIHQAELQ